MAGYGIGTDHFGIGSADLQLIESSSTPKTQVREQATNADDNFVAEDQYDGSAAEAVECLYELQSNTLDLSTLALGHITNGGDELAIETITVTTSNGAWPQVRVTGYKTVTDYTNWEDFSLPAITISGKKQAQALGFSVGADCRLTSSQLTATGSLSYTLDTNGDVGAMGFSGADVVVTAEAVEIAGAVSFSPDTTETALTWIETQPETNSTTNISWATGSFEMGGGLTPDT